MLVLTRRKKEVVNIYPKGGGVIKIYVLNFGRDFVRLGVDADKEIPVLREEIDDGKYLPVDSRVDEGPVGS